MTKEIESISCQHIFDVDGDILAQKIYHQYDIFSKDHEERKYALQDKKDLNHITMMNGILSEYKQWQKSE